MHRGRPTLLVLAVIVAYVFCTWLAHTVQEGFDNVTLIWMPAGVALAALVNLGWRYWPAIAVADAIAQYLNPNTPDIFIPFSVTTNTLAALLGTAVVLRIAGAEGARFSLRTGVGVLAGGVVVAVASAPLGVTGLVVSGVTPAEAFFAALTKWIATDLFGVLLVTPALTLAYGEWRQGGHDAQGVDQDHYGGSKERLAWFSALIVFVVALLEMRSSVPQFSLGFAAGPLALLIWSAIRFPPLFSAVASLCTGVGLIFAVGNEMFGFPAPATHPDSVVLLFFLSTVAVAPLFLAAAQQERRLAMAEVLAGKRELEQRVRARTADLQASNSQLSAALSELKETQQALVEQEKLAALGGLVAGVAHEVNTPVGVATTSASALEHAAQQFRQQVERGELTRRQLGVFLHDVEEGVGLILRNLRRAAGLVASFKQVAVDQSSQERRRFDLRGFFDEVVLSLGSLYKRRAEVVVECPEGIEMDSYPGPLFQVLSNLIGNAVMHAFTDESIGRIRIAARAANGDQVVIDFEDNGAGMTSEVAAHAFDPFFTTRRGQGGSGLGLHIVYNLVTGALGGRITLRSSPGAGSCFHIELPRTAP